MSNQLQVLYIGGYGRSGSTLLGRLVGASDPIESLGELYKLPRQFANERAHCGCLRPVNHCPLWKEVRNRLKNEFKQTWKFLKSSHQDVSVTWSAPWSELDSRRFRTIHNQLFESIRTTVHDSVQYVTDTSKTTIDTSLRPFLLRRCKNVSVRMIHLIRDGRACLWSKYKRDRRKQQNVSDPSHRLLERLQSHPILRTGLHWPYANVVAQVYQMLYPSDYIRVRYEEMTNQPITMLERLESFLDTDLSNSKELVINDQPIPNVHQIDGNRLRLKENLRLHEDRQSWKEHLTPTQKRLYKLFGGFLIHLYGY